MGEIGFPRREFLYELVWWEIKSIIRGYNRRHRDQWSAVRWQTYNLMCAFAGSKSLSENGIHGPKDLLPLPWDTDDAIPISQDEIDDLQREMRMYNENLKNQQQ